MSKENNNTPAKKDFRKEVSNQLENSLGSLKVLWGEKKFNSRLKKAVKILTEGLATDKKEPKKKAAPEAKPGKKSVKTKVPPEKALTEDKEPVKLKVEEKKASRAENKVNTGKK